MFSPTVSIAIFSLMFAGTAFTAATSTTGVDRIKFAFESIGCLSFLVSSVVGAVAGNATTYSLRVFLVVLALVCWGIFVIITLVSYIRKNWRISTNDSYIIIERVKKGE